MWYQKKFYSKDIWSLLIYLLLINEVWCFTTERNITSLNKRLPSSTMVTLHKVGSFCQEMSITVVCDECDRLHCNGCDDVIDKTTLANDKREDVHVQDESAKEAINSRFENKSKELIESVEENKTSLEEEKIEKEILQKLNRDLQNQISTLKKQMKEKDTELQKYLPQNKEGIWEKASDGVIPVGGVLTNGNTYKWYVGRIKVEGEVVPCYVIPTSQDCHVYHNGERNAKTSYEVLVNSTSVEWICANGDQIPIHAVPGGKMKDGEILYIGRVKHGHYYVGKIQPSMKGCYTIPKVNGDYTLHKNYEILVWK